MHRPIRLLPILLLLTSCASFRFEAQELSLRHDAESDSLDLRLLYEGVHAKGRSSRELEESVASLRRIARGARQFMLFDGWLQFDLEALPEKEAGEAEWQQGLRAFAQDAVALDHVLFKDERGRLGLYQRMHFPGAQRFVALCNAAFDATLLEASASGSFARKTPLLDAQSRKLWIECARDGVDWLRLVPGGLELSAPLTPAASARVLESFVLESRRSEFDPAPILAWLHEVSFTGDRLVLRLAPDPGGAFRIRRPRPDWKYGRALLDALTGDADLPRHELAALRARL